MHFNIDIKHSTHMRKIFILTAVALIAALSASAVTRDEMEQARTIAAKVYLRWANNGSDYLDKINATSISGLEEKLRDREKENIKAFKKIPVPSGYEQWDKTQLINYWSGTALNTSGLNADGVRSGARSQIKSRLGQMSVSAAAQAPAETPAAVKDTVAQVPDLEPAEAEVVAEEVSLTDSIEEATDSIEQPVRKSSSQTWIYVVALALLVIAVIVLVVYASRNMKNNNASGDEDHRPSRQPRREEAPEAATSRITVTRAANATEGAEPDDMRIMREKYAGTLAARQDEIRQLNRRMAELESENEALRNRTAQLEEECERMRRETLLSPAPASASPAASAQRSAAPAGTRQIFLGRVNANGIFVRADRTLNPGNSIYVLHTTDGFSGTFRVAPDQSVYETAFAHPQDMLSGGCVAMDITNTRDKQTIITEAAGTAIFENNCWKVIRKAKIRYE